MFLLAAVDGAHVDSTESSALLQATQGIRSFAVDALAVDVDRDDEEKTDEEKHFDATTHTGFTGKTNAGLKGKTNAGPKEPPINGVLPGVGKPHFIMGMDIDYPPYAYLPQGEFVKSPEDIDEVAGVGADMIKAMAKHCNFDVTVVQAHWSDCWNNGEIGQGLLQGWYHGCMTYTHATGVRNRYLEFTDSWASPNKPSGLIVKLTDGKPAISGNDDLSGKTIVDVTGWAPTADTVKFVTNKCTGEPFGDVTVIQGDDIVLDNPSVAKGANDKALQAILEGKADAMWIYGDQAANYHCAEGAQESGWNCDLWSGLGTDFAYLHSGMYGWMYNGTTIAMSRKGSGVAKILDDCFVDFQKSKEFYDVCKMDHGHPPHNQLNTCIPNEHFQSDPDFKDPDVAHYPFLFGTNEHSDCSTGYCPCSTA